MPKNIASMPKGRYAKLTLDWTFKKAFASEGYSDLLIALLNIFLKRKLTHKITKVRIANPYVQGQTKDDRDAIFDIHCEDSKGNKFIVEMQMAKQAYFIKRTLFYICLAIVNSNPKSKDWDFNYQKVYSLNFVNFNLDFGEGNDDIVQYISLSCENNPKWRCDYISLVYVLLPRFRKKLDECKTLEDKLLFALRYMHKLKDKPAQFKGNIFEKLFNIAEFSNFSGMEKTQYMSQLMARYDRSAQLSYAKNTGIKTGLRRGRKIERMETAKNMLKEKFDLATIARITKLPKEQIIALR